MLRKEARLLEAFMSLPGTLDNKVLKKMAEFTMLNVVKEAQEANPSWYNMVSSLAPESANLPESYGDLSNWEPPNQNPSVGAFNSGATAAAMADMGYDADDISVNSLYGR